MFTWVESGHYRLPRGGKQRLPPDEHLAAACRSLSIADVSSVSERLSGVSIGQPEPLYYFLARALVRHASISKLPLA